MVHLLGDSHAEREKGEMQASTRTYQPSLAEVRYRSSVHVVRAGMDCPAGSAVDFTVTLFESSSA